MKNKALSIFLIFLSFFVLATVASAGKETQLTHGERLTSGISFYDNHVFWTESAGNGVHAYNLTTGIRTDIDGHAAEGQTHAHGNKVVWTGETESGHTIYMYDVSTGNETVIASERRGPDIYGNYIVYNGDQSNGVYLYDLNTGSETKIASVHGYPAIYDKKVVWSQANNSGGYDICIYDICNHQTSTITTTNSSSYESQGLDIYEDTVMWTESHKLYMYDMASHKKTQITNSGNVSEPVIYGNWIVYTYDLDGVYIGDIYMYNISTARTTRITTSDSAFSPSIYEDKIVYADSRDSEYGDVRDIYLYDLSSIVQNPPEAEFTANVTSGTAPLVVLFTELWRRNKFNKQKLLQ